jgi:hypothetical protein
MTLVVVIPITVGWSPRPAPEPTPEVVIRPAILANRVASSKEITPHDLPKAQAPPLQPLQYSRGRVAPKIKSEKGRPKTLQAKVSRTRALMLAFSC